MEKEKKCRDISRNEIFLLDLFIHIFTLLLVLSLFFFLFVSKQEKEGLEDVLDDNIKKFTESQSFNPVQKESVQKVNNFYKNDNQDEQYNDFLFLISFLIVGFLLVTVITIYLTMVWSGKKCPRLVELFVYNLLVFLIVGAVEFLFFTNYAKKFVPVKPSFITGEFVKEINKKN